AALQSRHIAAASRISIVRRDFVPRIGCGAGRDGKVAYPLAQGLQVTGKLLDLLLLAENRPVELVEQVVGEGHLGLELRDAVGVFVLLRHGAPSWRSKARLEPKARIAAPAASP